MSVLTTTTFDELLVLNEYPVLSVHWKIEAHLLVDGEKRSVANVLAYYKIADYEKRYYSDIFITIEVDPLVHRDILNNTNKLQITLTKAQQSADGLINKEVRRISQLFNAHLTDATNVNLIAHSGSGRLKGDAAEQSSGLRTLTFNLIEPIVAEMRFAETGGIFRETTIKKLLKITLGYGLAPVPNEELWGDPTYTGIRGVDVIEPDNERVYKHLVIPNGTRLMQIPKYLQEEYGIYSSGMGWHIEDGRCYIYPLLKNTEYAKRHKVLTILNVPTDEIPTMERTFILRGKEIYVFSTGETEHEDLTDRIQNNLGNGMRFTPASDVLDRMSETSENITHVDVKKNVRSYLVDKRPDEKENVRFVPGRFTDNPYVGLSKLTEGLGTRIKVNWDNSDPSLLYPGMQVKYLYKDAGEVKELKGVLVGLETITAPATDSILDNHFITKCVMVIQLSRITAVEL